MDSRRELAQRSQHFKGFTSEFVANEWIAKKLQTWLNSTGKTENG